MYVCLRQIRQVAFGHAVDLGPRETPVVQLYLRVRMHACMCLRRAAAAAAAAARGNSSGGTRVTPKDEIASERVTLAR